jgi:phosphatidylethanolamine/phosphatidyl-N-methylethanolamine N-methyltransferase
MALQHSYRLLAPIYDRVIARATESMRRQSLSKLNASPGEKILLSGVGTGLDFPWLPQQAKYQGIDITPAMLARAQQRLPEKLDITLQCASVYQLPFTDNSFDHIVMHLILAVVARPERALIEAQRVLRPGGQILILDKFLRPGQLAPVRRIASLFLRHVVTRTDVVFENIIRHCPQLDVMSDEPVAFSTWFRSIRLIKKD